jgi:hypothetical protein
MAVSTRPRYQACTRLLHTIHNERRQYPRTYGIALMNGNEARQKQQLGLAHIPDLDALSMSSLTCDISTFAWSRPYNNRIYEGAGKSAPPPR